MICNNVMMSNPGRVAYIILAPHTKLLDMVRPADPSFSLALALGIFRYGTLYSVLNVLC